MISTVSSAQTGKPLQDTVKCYGFTELKYISATLVEARACDTLLGVAKLKLANRDSLIMEKNIELSALSGQNILKDQILKIKEEEIRSITLHLKKAELQKKWLKFGWGSTSVVLGAGILWALFR